MRNSRSAILALALGTVVTLASLPFAATDDSWEEKDSGSAAGGTGGGGAGGGGDGDEGGSQPSSPGVEAPGGAAAVDPSADTPPGVGLEAGPDNPAQGAGGPQGPPTGGSPTDEQNFQKAREEKAARPTREQLEKELNERIRLGARGGSPNEGRSLTIDEALDLMAKGTRVTPSSSTRFHEQVFANLEERLGREASGNTPPAFTVGDGIRIDLNSMTPAQQQRFRELFKQQNPQK